jgi:adenylate cyclase
MTLQDGQVERSDGGGEGRLRPIRLASEPALRVGALELHPRLRRLAHEDGREAFLEPRVMQVLVALARADGDVVTRDELLAACWNGVVVGEDAIERVIGRVRRVGKSFGEFSIDTVSKVGYRLRASAAPARAKAPAAPPKPTLCVLPFLNMSDDPQQGYFSDGITEDIITDLSKVSALFVLARTTAFAQREAAQEIPQLARRLNVSHVLEGSVRKAGGRLRITAQLVDGASGGHLWAERYDRDLKDVFTVQDEISKAIVRALRVKLLPAEKVAIEQRETSDPAAYDLCLMARRFYGHGHIPEKRELNAIVRLCRRATGIDPGYARAWGLLSLAERRLHFAHDEPGEPGREAAERCRALDPRRPEPYAVQARYLWSDGRSSDAWAEIQTGLSLDPDCWDLLMEAGRICYLEHRFEDAVPFYEKAIGMSGSCVGCCELLSSYHALGDEAGVRRAAEMLVADAERLLALDHINVEAMSSAAGACVALGQMERARGLLDRSLLLDPDSVKVRYNFACALSTYAGDVQGALEMLEEVFPSLTPELIAVAKRDPDLQPLRGHPRFEALFAA